MVSWEDEERGKDKKMENFESHFQSWEGSRQGRITFCAEQTRLWFLVLYCLTPTLNIFVLHVHSAHAVQDPRLTPSYSDRKSRCSLEVLIKYKYKNYIVRLERYRDTHISWDFRDNRTEFIQFLFTHLTFPADVTMLLSLPNFSINQVIS